MGDSGAVHQRRALVTGGASGIGYAIAEALLHSGARVAIGDINEDAVMNAATKLNSPNLVPLALDVTSRSSVQAAVATSSAQFGGLDTLVNCAGILYFTPLSEISVEEWDRVINVDLKGVFLCCQAVAPLLIADRRGRIVTISSDAGKKGYPWLASYCAAKAGVIGLSKAIAGELAPYGVTVNCVCPTGVTSTGMGQQVLEWLTKKTGEPTEKVLASREQGTPLKRMATTCDVVNAVMFFISDDSSFLTGEALNVDGGVLSTVPIPGM
jgi:meso-butanediol dehydrogenase/(S,S)-butanediol dehydrogenase/diacetyl reductase